MSEVILMLKCDVISSANDTRNSIFYFEEMIPMDLIIKIVLTVLMGLFAMVSFILSNSKKIIFYYFRRRHEKL